MVLESKEVPKHEGNLEQKQNLETVNSYPLYWDERDRYSFRERELIKNLGADKFGEKIHVTELGTIYVNNGDESKELLFDDFIKRTEKKIIKGESAIKYDKDSNKFYLIESDNNSYISRVLAFEFDIKQEVMDDYAFGNYNHVTSSLHNLYLQSMSVEERKILEQNKEQERNEIIAKSNLSHEELTPAEARIYLDYLEELKRSNAKVIRGKTKNVALASTIPTTAGIAIGTIIGGMADATATIAITGVFVGTMAAASVQDLFLEFTGREDNYSSSIPGATTFKYIKNAVNSIKEKKQANKVIDAKTQILYEKEAMLDKMVIAHSYDIEEFDKTLNDEELESLNLKNSIINSLDELVNRINLLNSADKMAFLIETQEILTEYTERYTAIVNQDKNRIDLEADSFMKLKIETLTKIADLETRVNEVRQKDVQIKQVTDESRLLTDKIEGFSDFDLDLQRTHTITENKVKVKKLIRDDMPESRRKHMEKVLSQSTKH